MYKYFTVSKHARERFLERADMDKIIRDYASRAFKKGRKFTEKEFEEQFDKGMVNQNGKYWTREYRKYMGLLWVFGGRSETKDTQTWRIISVIPTK